MSAIEKLAECEIYYHFVLPIWVRFSCVTHFAWFISTRMEWTCRHKKIKQLKVCVCVFFSLGSSRCLRTGNHLVPMFIIPHGTSAWYYSAGGVLRAPLDVSFLLVASVVFHLHISLRSSYSLQYRSLSTTPIPVELHPCPIMSSDLRRFRTLVLGR